MIEIKIGQLWMYQPLAGCMPALDLIIGVNKNTVEIYETCGEHTGVTIASIETIHHENDDGTMTLLEDVP